MTYFIEVPKKDAEKAKAKLIENDTYLKGIKAKSNNDFVYFPIKNNKIKTKYKIVNKKSENYFMTRSLKDILVKDLKIKDYICSYDVVGDIAILKMTPEMEKQEKKIAELLLESNPNFKTVVKKTDAFHGTYRIEGVKYIAGKKTLTTIVKESNCQFLVKLGKMFFSTRLSFERERIAKLVKEGSTVGVFFSGVSPFSIVIANKKPSCKIYSIELNKEAHKQAIENVKINKTENVIPICADVSKYAKNIANKCDYIIMPLPKTSNLFLEAAYTAIKKKPAGQITLYKFVPTKEPYKELLKELKDFAKTKKKKIKVIFKRQVRDYSPDIMQIAIDFKFID